MPRIKEVKADWEDVVLICRKCSKRLGGGFGPGGDRKLGKALGAELNPRGGKRRRGEIGVLEVACLDICPKGAVMALRAGRPGRLLAVPAGMTAQAVLQALGIAVPDSENGPAGPP